MSFDPDKYSKDIDREARKKKKSGFDPDAYMKSIEPKEESAMDDLAFIGEGLDRVTGAPVRAGIGALQDEDPETGFFKSAYDQFLEPAHLAPTGKEIAQKAGVSDDVIYKDAPLVGDITKSGLAGFGVDLFADAGSAVSVGSKLLGKGIRSVKPVKIALKDRASKKALKAVAQQSSESKIGKLLGKGKRQRLVGQTLLDEGLGKHLNNPVKLIDEMTKDSGLISKYSDETSDIIRQVSGKANKVDMGGLIEKLSFEDAIKRYDPEVAIKLDDTDMGKYNDLLDKWLKPDIDTQRSVSQLQELKKSIGKQLNSDIFFQPTDKSLSFEKEVLRDIYRTLKEQVEQSTKGIPVDIDGVVMDASEVVGINNQKVSSMMDTMALLEKIPAKELKGMSGGQEMVDLITSGLTGIAVGGATGSTGLGLAAAGAYGGSKLGKNLARKLPAVEANLIDKIIKGEVMPDKTIMGAQVPRVMSIENNSREPQSVNIPEELIRTPIPRSTEGMLENKEVLRLKLAQQAPEMYEQVMEIMDNQPELISDIVPVLSQMMPHLFEQDKYGRFDGVILDPQKKEMARQDMMNNDDLSNSQKMLMMNKLNKTGEFDL